jgi:hypothetical protein
MAERQRKHLVRSLRVHEREKVAVAGEKAKEEAKRTVCFVFLVCVCVFIMRS